MRGCPQHTGNFTNDNNETAFICVNCGKKIGINDTEGSMKHPYCKKCFKEVWCDNYKKYVKWLGETHG